MILRKATLLVIVTLTLTAGILCANIIDLIKEYFDCLTTTSKMYDAAVDQYNKKIYDDARISLDEAFKSSAEAKRCRSRIIDEDPAVKQEDKKFIGELDDSWRKYTLLINILDAVLRNDVDECPGSESITQVIVAKDLWLLVTAIGQNRNHYALFTPSLGQRTEIDPYAWEDFLTSDLSKTANSGPSAEEVGKNVLAVLRELKDGEPTVREKFVARFQIAESNMAHNWLEETVGKEGAVLAGFDSVLKKREKQQWEAYTAELMKGMSSPSEDPSRGTMLVRRFGEYDRKSYFLNNAQLKTEAGKLTAKTFSDLFRDSRGTIVVEKMPGRSRSIPVGPGSKLKVDYNSFTVNEEKYGWTDVKELNADKIQAYKSRAVQEASPFGNFN